MMYTPLWACVHHCVCLCALFMPVATFSLHGSTPFYKPHQLPWSLDPEAYVYAWDARLWESSSCIPILHPPAVVSTPNTKRSLLHFVCHVAFLPFARMLRLYRSYFVAIVEIVRWLLGFLLFLLSLALTCLGRRIGRGLAETLDRLWGCSCRVSRW